MPIVATSQPIIFGGSDSTPTPSTPRPIISSPSPTGPTIHPSSDFVAAHQHFIKQVDNLNSCFKINQITDFTDTEREEHIQIAIIDQYLVKHDDMYCSKQGIKILSNKLKRFID